MCTLSLLRAKQATIVTMNRDEARSRHEGKLQNLQEQGLQRVYPLDQQAGGTWFGLNNHCLVLALLNRYQDPQRLGMNSRGLIIPKALRAKNLELLLSSLTQADYQQVNPFDLVVISPSHSHHLAWTGRKLVHHEITDEFWQLSSSGRHPQQTLPYRRQLFEQWQQGLAKQAAPSQLADSVFSDYHCYQDPNQPQHSVLMDRPDAHSKSISQVLLQSGQVDFSYYPENYLQALREDRPLEAEPKSQLSFSCVTKETQDVSCSN